MTSEEIQELREEMRQEMKEEMYEEMRIRTDIDYAYEKLGIDELHEALQEFANRMCDYGYDIDIYDVMNRLEEI